MRQPTFAVLNLLLFCPWLIAAAPPSAHSHHLPKAHTDGHSPASSWRQFADAVIHRIWGLPVKQKPLSAIKSHRPSLTGGSPSRKLLARYGEDIVIRFNVTSAEEATALAEATETLFLDVWEFNDDWVDIRIAKDVVREQLLLSYERLLTFSSSFPPCLDYSPNPYKPPMYRSCKTSTLPRPSLIRTPRLR